MNTRFAAKAIPILRRTAVRTWDDGFIHAGNLAYLSMLAIFPFFILGAALFSLFGSAAYQMAMVDTVLTATTPTVREIVGPVARSTVEADTGWLIWVGAAVGLWTLSSLIESIREIMRRAYDTQLTYPYWKSRLFSIAVILIAVLLMMVSLFVQVAIGTVQQAIASWSPQIVDGLSGLRLSRIVPALGLFLSLYLVFLTLTPSAYRTRDYPKWPGALATSLWWLFVTTVLPIVVSQVVTYDIIYGSLAGIMLVLFFFWLVGLGLVMGAELNASLAGASATKNTNEEKAS